MKGLIVLGPGTLVNLENEQICLFHLKNNEIQAWSKRSHYISAKFKDENEAKIHFDNLCLKLQKEQNFIVIAETTIISPTRVAKVYHRRQDVGRFKTEWKYQAVIDFASGLVWLFSFETQEEAIEFLNNVIKLLEKALINV